MNTKVKGIIIGASVVSLVVFVKMYMTRPKGKIYINEDGSGNVIFGGKTRFFKENEVVEIRTWNGWKLHASSKHITLANGKKTIEDGVITPYDGGSSYIEIIHSKGIK